MLRNPVEISVDDGVLKELAVLYESLEVVLVHEVIVNAVDLAGSPAPGCCRHRVVEIAAIVTRIAWMTASFPTPEGPDTTKTRGRRPDCRSSMIWSARSFSLTPRFIHTAPQPQFARGTTLQINDAP